MLGRRSSASTTTFVFSGAVAGALSALAFTVVHYFLISPIWFALFANLVAGAVSGACIAWSYALAVPAESRFSWVSYNAAFVFILIALAGTSVLLFDPVTTIPALLKSNAPPRALIGRALPVTLTFTLVTAVLLSLRYRAGWLGSVALVITALVIVLFLGLNLSILGLVFVPRGSYYLLFEVIALILGLAFVYAGIMSLIWRRAHQ